MSDDIKDTINRKRGERIKEARKLDQKLTASGSPHGKVVKTWYEVEVRSQHGRGGSKTKRKVRLLRQYENGTVKSRLYASNLPKAEADKLPKE